MSAFRLHMRLVVAAGSLALAGGALAAGCGGGGLSGDYSTQMSFCQVLAQADCSDPVVRACYGADDSSVGTDTTTCIAARSALDRCNPAGLPYHSQYAQDCVDAHTNLYGSSQLDPGLFQAAQQACLGVFNKGGTQGASCSSDADCAVTPVAENQPSLVCIIHQGAGTCQIPNLVNAGDKCQDPTAQCPDGYSCLAGGYCVANPGSGEACGPGITCGNSVSKLRCDLTTMKCAAPFDDGQACTDVSECSGNFCVPTAKGGICSHTYTLALGAPACEVFVSK